MMDVGVTPNDDLEATPALLSVACSDGALRWTPIIAVIFGVAPFHCGAFGPTRYLLQHTSEQNVSPLLRLRPLPGSSNSTPHCLHVSQ